MRVLGIDPGKTIGVCLYDGAVLDAAEFGNVADLRTWLWRSCGPNEPDPMAVDIAALEWPRMYSKGGNDIADTCAQAGWIWCALGGERMPIEGGSVGAVRALTRQDVVGALSRKLGQQVRGDAGVWAALLDLHGGKGIADSKTGPLAALKGKPHAKAALAVAWAAMSLDTARVSR